MLTRTEILVLIDGILILSLCSSSFFPGGGRESTVA